MPPLNRKYYIIKRLAFSLGFVLVTGFTTNSNKNDSENERNEITTVNNHLNLLIPYLPKNFVAFKEALGFRESQGDYTAVNKYGYVGKYQFGNSALTHFKIYNKRFFLENPELQEKAFKALCKMNKWILRKEISRFKGTYINGILITESGILAAAHLGGTAAVRRYLRSYGKYDFKDGFGTSIEVYLKNLGGYDTSNIIPQRRPKIN